MFWDIFFRKFAHLSIYFLLIAMVMIGQAWGMSMQ